MPTIVLLLGVANLGVRKFSVSAKSFSWFSMALRLRSEDSMATTIVDHIGRALDIVVSDVGCGASLDSLPIRNVGIRSA